MRTCTEASVEHAPARLQRELDRLRLPIANLTLLSVLLVITSEEHGLMQKNINRLKITEYITYFKTKTLKLKENGLHLIQANRFQEAYNVREVKYLRDSDISFLLGLGNEPVQQNLITTHQRLGYLLTLSTERNAYYKMHVDTAEDHRSSRHLSITVRNKAYYKASRLDDLQKLCCRLINGGKTCSESWTQRR